MPNKDESPERGLEILNCLLQTLPDTSVHFRRITESMVTAITSWVTLTGKYCTEEVWHILSLPLYLRNANELVPLRTFEN